MASTQERATDPRRRSDRASPAQAGSPWRRPSPARRALLTGWIGVIMVAAAAGCARGEGGNPGRSSANVEGRAGASPPASAVLPDSVRLTWLSVTNWLLEAGETRLLLDGYVSRIDRTTVNPDGSSTAFAPPDDAAVSRVRDAILPAGGLDWILVGHGHWDHAFDTPSWARLTGARVGGARSVCLVLVASGVPTDRCRPFEGGESFEAGPGVHVRVVRWAHSGDSATVDGRRLRAPLELRSAPAVDPATGGLRPGYLEDYPNGGGVRAYLITVATTRGPVTIFWSNTGNPQAWDEPIPADSAFFREQRIDTSNLEWSASDVPVRVHLETALRAEALDSVHVWIGPAVAGLMRQVAGVLHPRTFVPNHWDDFWSPLANGAGSAFPAARFSGLLGESGIALLVTPDYFDGIVVTPTSASAVDGASVRARLGVRSVER